MDMSESRVRTLLGQFLAEFLGTALLGLLATGTAMSMMENGSILGAALGTGLSLVLAIGASGGVSGGHVNPAVTLAQVVFGQCSLLQLPVYMLAQYMGAFCGRAIFYLAFVDQFEELETETYHSLFAAFPTEDKSLISLIYTEILASALLMLSICFITNEKNLGFPKYLYPLSIGLSLSTIILCLARSGGGGVNPAMDFSGRVLVFLIGDGKAFSNKSYFFWVPLVLPHVGAVLGALIHFLAVKPFTSEV